MAHINGRFHEVSAWSGESEALPPGPDYAFQIEGVEQGVSPQKQTPQLNVTCIVLNEGENYGRKGIFRYNLNLDKEAPRKRLRSLIDATGIPMDADGGIDDQDLIGRQFLADVIAENYDVVDGTTGTKITKTASRIQNERPLDGANQAADAAAPQAVAPAPAAAAPAPAPAPAAAAPAARAAIPAPRPAAAAAPAARPAYTPPSRGAPLTRVQ
jgi:hypothetical protein